MRVLVACEFSGVVRDAFSKKGHEAVSCDLLPSEKPGMHFETDVMNVIANKYFGDWDMMIAFPPCTYLCRSGARWWRDKNYLHQEARSFFMNLTCAPIEKIAIENPVGAMSTYFKKPDQIIQPWMFGDPVSKKTCLWLKNLPKLEPTKIVKPTKKMGDFAKKNRSKNRSRMYPGIADAMADQWQI